MFIFNHVIQYVMHGSGCTQEFLFTSGIFTELTREVSPTDMANDVKEIEYLTKQLEGIMQSVSPQNWDDVADSWFNLGKLSRGECTGSRRIQFTWVPRVASGE